MMLESAERNKMRNSINNSLIVSCGRMPGYCFVGFGVVGGRVDKGCEMVTV